MNYYNSDTLLEQQQEIQKLKDERNELAAQVQALRDTCSYWIERSRPEHHCTKTEFNTWLALGHQSNAMTKSAQHHLLQVRADAGRAGFIAGYMLCNDGSPLIKHNYEGAADKYHASILAGEE